MEFTEEILCWVKADNKRTMLTIGWIIGKKLPNYFQKNKLCSMFRLQREKVSSLYVVCRFFLFCTKVNLILASSRSIL